MNEEQLIEAEPKWNTDNVDDQGKTALRICSFLWLNICNLLFLSSFCNFVYAEFHVTIILLVVFFKKEYYVPIHNSIFIQQNGFHISTGQHKCHHLSSLMQDAFSLNYTGDDKYQVMDIFLKQMVTNKNPVERKCQMSYVTEGANQTWDILAAC